MNWRILATALAVGMATDFGAYASPTATPFGPASGVLAFGFSPTVSLGASSGSATLDGALLLFSQKGSLSGTTTGGGTVSGTLAFSEALDTAVTESVQDFLIFTDTSGGTFDFNVSSVTTTAYRVTPGVSTGITLYALGTIGDTTLGLTPTLTSVTFGLTTTGDSAYSVSATLANPPAPLPGVVPEPASLAMLGTGLIGLGLIRLRSRGSNGALRQG